jgi:hypothetical protein
LEKFKVEKFEVMWMTLTDFNSTSNVFNPSKADVLKSYGVTREEVLWMLALYFRAQDQLYHHVLGNLSKPAWRGPEAEILDAYGVSGTDTLWMAHLGITGSAPENSTLAEITYGLSNGGQLEPRTHVLPDGNESTWHVIVVGASDAHDRLGETFWPEWPFALANGSLAPGAMRFAGWDALMTTANSSSLPWPGGTCGLASQFTTEVGKLFVTSRVDFGATYVLEAGEGSIEVTGAGLRPARDRIMIVDCEATCGRDDASSRVAFPLYGEGPASYFEPVRAPAPDTVPCPEDSRVTHDNPYLVNRSFTEVRSRYCTHPPITTATGAAKAQLTEHGCERKCRKMNCKGDTCFCSGDVPGASSGAICLPKEECEHLCMLLGDECHSVNMHKTLPHCYLNTPACVKEDDHDDETWGISEDYSLLIKGASTSMDVALAEATPDDPWSVEWPSSTRRDLASTTAWSSSSLLRFAPLTLPTTGTYKVCFCDTDLLDGAGCQKASDFAIEVGKVHVSGMSCLLGIPSLRSASCIEQSYGGLRCAVDN